MNAIATIDAPEVRRYTMRGIIAAACAHFDVSYEEMISQRKDARIIEARFAAIHAIRVLTPRSYPEIGTALGGRDHTTVRDAAMRVQARMETEPAYARMIEVFVDIARKVGTGEQADVDPFEVAAKVMANPAMAINVPVQTIRAFAAIVVAAKAEAERQQAEPPPALPPAPALDVLPLRKPLGDFLRAWQAHERASPTYQRTTQERLDKAVLAMVVAAETYFSDERV